MNVVKITPLNQELPRKDGTYFTDSGILFWNNEEHKFKIKQQPTWWLSEYDSEENQKYVSDAFVIELKNRFSLLQQRKDECDLNNNISGSINAITKMGVMLDLMQLIAENR